MIGELGSTINFKDPIPAQERVVYFGAHRSDVSIFPDFPGVRRHCSRMDHNWYTTVVPSCMYRLGPYPMTREKREKNNHDAAMHWTTAMVNTPCTSRGMYIASHPPRCHSGRNSQLLVHNMHAAAPVVYEVKSLQGEKLSILALSEAVKAFNF